MTGRWPPKITKAAGPLGNSIQEGEMKGERPFTEMSVLTFGAEWRYR